MKSQCIKSAWMYLILHEALGFPEERISLMTTSSVNGQSVQWSLGALLYHTRFLPLRCVCVHVHAYVHACQKYIVQ